MKRHVPLSVSVLTAVFYRMPSLMVVITAVAMTVGCIGSGAALAADISSVASGNWSASAWPNTTRTGTITTSTGSTTVTGSGTAFLSQVSPGNIIKTTANVAIGTVSSIESDTSLTLTANALSGNAGIGFNCQGIGPADNATISGHSIILDTNATVNNLNFAAASPANSLTHSSAYSLTVNGTVTLNGPSSPGTQNWNINAGSATVGGVINLNSLTSTRISRIVITTGILNANGGISFTGSFAPANVLYLSGSSGRINLKGTITNPAGATLTAGTAGSTFTYTDSAAQTIGIFGNGGYNNLTISNAGGATLGGNVTLTGNLSFTAGKLFTGAYTLAMGATGTISGASSTSYVAGKLQKAFNTGNGQSFTFPVGDAGNYTPVALNNMNIGTAGSITAYTTAGEHPNLATSGIHPDLDVSRYWTLTPAGGLAIASADATFTFVTGDLSIDANPADFIVRRYTAGAWYSASVGEKSPNSIQVTGLSTLGEFALGELSLKILTTTNLGAGSATLWLQSGATGTGYFTLLSGNGAICGSGAQTKAGLDSLGLPAFRIGSLPLVADTPGYYTVRNLQESSPYTVCFTAEDSGLQVQPVPAAADLTTTTARTFIQAWGAVGSAGFSAGAAYYTSLAFAPDGTPYVAYQDIANSYKATVRKFNGTSWVPVGSAGFSAAQADYTSLAFAPDGTPYLAYHDANSNKATVMKFNGTSWVVVGSTGFSAGAADYTSLAFAPDGTPYVAYKDEYNNYKASVMKFNGTNWILVGSAGFSASSANYTSLAFAPDGTPYVAYQDVAKATVMKFNGSSWVAVGSASFSAGYASYTSLAFAPDGTPYLAYMDDANSSRATVMKFNGSSWVLVGSAGFSAGAAYYTSLAFAPDGTPYLAYRDGANSYKATVMRFNGSSWVLVGSAGFSAGQASYSSLAFAPDGTPYVAYQDIANSYKATVMACNYIGISAISRLTPVTTATNIASVTFRATFSDPISGLSAANFALASTVNGAAITGVAAVGSTPAIQWDITVATGTGDGTLTLHLANSSGIDPQLTITLPFSDQGYSIDKTAPGISIGLPTSSTVISGGADYLITYADPNLASISLTAGDVSLNRTGTVNATASVSGSGNTRVVTLTELTGSGTLGISLSAGTAIDSAGNSAPSVGPSSTFDLPAPPAPTVAITNMGAGSATLILESVVTGNGYFTLLPGNGATCGSGAQTKAGLDSLGFPAFRIGSLPLTANTPGYYTVRNLQESSPYTVCFTAENSILQQPSVPAAADLTTTAARAFVGQAWGGVGSAGFSAGSAEYTSVAFAPDGRPYVAYRDGTLSYKATVMKYSGGVWSVVGSAGFSAGSAEYTSLAFAPDGAPYVAYRDAANSLKATVMKYSGGVWNAVGSAGFSAGEVDYISPAFAPDGTLHVAYRDYGNNSKATVMKYSGGVWSAVGSAGFSAGQAANTSLAFAPDGTPYVAYRDHANGYRATVMKYDGGVWNVVGSAGFSAGQAEYTPLVFAPDGTPYVAYLDGANSNKATVMKYSGGVWSVVGSAGFSAGEANYTSLAFAPDGTPHVAYRDHANSFKATVMKYSGGVWIEVGSGGFSTGNVYYTSLAFAPDGTLHVAYLDNANSDKATVMKLVGGPSVTTGTATGASATAAILHGTVNDNGFNTTVTFDYGLTTGYGSSVAGGTVTAGSGATPVSAPISGLTCGATYHFRVTATNSVATVSGSDQTFTTSACQLQSITFGTAPTIIVGGTGTASATGGASGNPVTFSSETPTVCTTSDANGATVTGVSAGTCIIAANQAGGGAYTAAPQATQSFAIDPSAAILTVTVTKTGSAFGTVTSDPVGISCTGSGTGCSQPFAFVPQVVRLFATPSATSIFSGWDGACSGTVSPCVLNLTADAAVTALFDPLPLVKTGGGSFFASIMEAYLAIGTGSGTLQLQSHEFDETFTFDQPITLILKGGYNSGFTAISGTTTIRGPVTIIDGTVIPEDISVGP